MVVLIAGEVVAGLLAFGITEWVVDNPIIATVLFGLLGLVFFMYLMLRRTVQGFKEGMQGGR